MISLKKYYAFALFLPLIVPAGMFLLFGENGFPKSALFVLPLILEAIPYAIFCLWAVAYHRRSDVVEIEKFSYKLPFYFIPFLLLITPLFFLPDNPLTFGVRLGLAYALDELGWHMPEYLGYILLGIIFGLVYCYVYVCIAHALRWVLQKIGFVQT